MKIGQFLNTILLLLFAILIFYLLYTNIFNGRLLNTFELLAQSFLAGRLDFLSSAYLLDAASYGGKLYWHQGPLPAVILIPYVLVKNYLNIGWIYFFFNILVILALYKVVKNILKNSFGESLWYIFIFIFGSVYTGVAFEAVGWYFAQIISVLFTLLALGEYFGRKRFFLIGLYFGAVLGTRIFSLLGIGFFIFTVLTSKLKLTFKFKQLFLFLFPVLFALMMLGIYNYARFGSVWETGYNYAISGELKAVSASRQGGLFNIKNIPTNIYWYFFKGPEAVYRESSDFKTIRPFLMPNPWGMSLFLVMPFFFTVFLKRIKGGEQKALLISIIIFMIFLLGYYTTGFRQYSARLVNDFLPYWFVLLLLQRRGEKLSNREKVFILATVFLNVYMLSAFKWYLFPEGGWVQVSHILSPHGTIIRE